MYHLFLFFGKDKCYIIRCPNCSSRRTSISHDISHVCHRCLHTWEDKQINKQANCVSVLKDIFCCNKEVEPSKPTR